jgi:hypothetical protein
MSSSRVFVALLLCLAPLPAAAEEKKETETVLVTHRVREGKESEYAALLARQWATLQRLGMVLPRPHLILRGTDESGGTIFVEVLTWKDHETPDNAPAEVEKIWSQLEALAQKRLGHVGIEFPEFQIVAAEDCGPGGPPSR